MTCSVYYSCGWLVCKYASSFNLKVWQVVLQSAVQFPPLLQTWTSSQVYMKLKSVLRSDLQCNISLCVGNAGCCQMYHFTCSQVLSMGSNKWIHHQGCCVCVCVCVCVCERERERERERENSLADFKNVFTVIYFYFGSGWTSWQTYSDCKLAKDELKYTDICMQRNQMKVRITSWG